MAVKQNNAEGGTNAVTPTTGDTGSGDPFDVVSKGPVAGILEYTNVANIHGGLCYRMATRGTSESNFVAHTTTAATTYFGRFYFMSDVAPASALRFCQFRTSEALGVLSSFYLNASGIITIREPVGATASYTFTNALTMAAAYRLEWNVITLGGTSITTQLRLYSGDSTSVIEDSGVIAITTGASQATWGDVRYGIPAAQTNVPSTTGYWYFDDVLAFETVWPGPSVSVSTPRRSLLGVGT